MRGNSAILFVCLAALPACNGPVWPFGGSGSVHEDPKAPLAETAAEAGLFTRSAEAPVRVVRLQFDVLRADMPIDVVQHSRKIWNHVDEFRLEPRLTALLARNGIRMGVGAPGAWVPLRSIFTAARARLREESYAAVHGLPLVLRLEAMPAPETIFTYGVGGSLVGKTIPAGEKLLVIDYRTRPELSGAVDVQMSMEIRVDRGELEWRTEGGVLRQMPAFDRHRFAELGVLLTLQPGEFLVVGPSEDTANDHMPLLGSRFFTGDGESGRIESVLCITPAVSGVAGS